MRAVAAALGLWALAGPAAAAGTVYVTTVEGPIFMPVARHVERATARGASENAAALVIELDTPGGLLDATQVMVKAILNSPIPVIVFVSPRGSSASSAGVFITLAGHVAAMAPGTNIGAAHPVVVSPLPAPTEPEQDEEPPPPPARDIMGEKLENWAAAFIESIAELRERNVEWAADAVRNSVAITQKEAVELNVVDLVAEDVPDLLEQVDGREVTVERRKVVLATRDARIVRIEMSASDRFLSVISSPTIATLLLLGGLGLLYVEVSNPGILVPGAVGLICLVLAGLAFQIIPFNSLGLLLMLAGLGLMVAEVFVTSFGLLFAGGVACLALGGYLLFDVPEIGDVAVPFTTVILPAVIGFAIVGAIIVFGVSRSFLRPQFAGSEGMVGETAVADTDLTPSGRVFLHGEFWNAEADEPISKGERVRIVEIRELAVRVTRAYESGGGSS